MSVSAVKRSGCLLRGSAVLHSLDADEICRSRSCHVLSYRKIEFNGSAWRFSAPLTKTCRSNSFPSSTQLPNLTESSMLEQYGCIPLVSYPDWRLQNRLDSQLAGLTPHPSLILISQESIFQADDLLLFFELTSFLSSKM
jgi:hypothetical protein